MTKIGENFPLSRVARKARLKKIVENEKPISAVKVPGHGPVNVYKIPLEFLSYNPYNTRFLAQAKTYEKRLGRLLSDERAEDVTEIEKFLWKLKEDKNENTIKSLIKEGQLQAGVVTNEGVVLSGNRRFRLLNEISRNHAKYKEHNLEGLKYFEAAILPDTLTERDIRIYESFYQYGNEDKVEYDPIQKYIAADEQQALDIDLQDIANNFMVITNGKVKIVQKWLEVFKLMKEYLEYIGEDGIYTALASREEAFLNLYDTEKSLVKGKKGKEIWAFEDLDIIDLRHRYFDYIRMEKSTHDFRLLIKIFSDENRWTSFNKNVEEATLSYEIDSLDEYRKRNVDLSESEISVIRQNDYSDHVGKALDKLFGDERAFITAKEQEETPFKAIDAVLAKLTNLQSQINAQSNTDAFISADFEKRFESVKKIVFDMEKKLKRL